MRLNIYYQLSISGVSGMVIHVLQSIVINTLVWLAVKLMVVLSQKNPKILNTLAKTIECGLIFSNCHTETFVKVGKSTVGETSIAPS